MTTTGQRWIALEGAVNVRDLGGLPTVDGATTVPDRLLRADNLQGLTAADVRLLMDRYKVRQVLDLRTEVEVRLEGPGPLSAQPSVEHHVLSLLPVVGRTTDMAAEDVLPWASDVRQSLHRRRGGPMVASALYLRYLQDRPDSILSALRTIGGLDEGASIVHCAAGKDRTGVVSALALSVAGVEPAAIIADYAASGEVIDAIVARLVASPTYAADIAARPVASHRPEAESMRLFLAGLDHEFGSPVGWLDGHGFGPADQDRLRARLLS